MLLDSPCLSDASLPDMPRSRSALQKVLSIRDVVSHAEKASRKIYAMTLAYFFPQCPMCLSRILYISQVNL